MDETYFKENFSRIFVPNPGYETKPGDFVKILVIDVFKFTVVYILYIY